VAFAWLASAADSREERKDSTASSRFFSSVSLVISFFCPCRCYHSKAGLFQGLEIFLMELGANLLLKYQLLTKKNARMHRVPGSHSQILLIGFLLWFISLVPNRDPEDDWAGTA